MEEDKEIRLRIGKRIAELRMKKGYSQEKLAELTGFKQQNINSIENGRYSTGLDILGKIEKALDCEFNLNEK